MCNRNHSPPIYSPSSSFRSFDGRPVEESGSRIRRQRIPGFRVSLMAGSSEGNKRLCDLPDAILIRILSFLPTKSLVSTSLLSRRWRYLWTSTLNLRIDESQFKDRNKFMNFAERALVLRAGSSLVSFSLSCGVENDGSRINTWITSAIQHNVEKLSLSLQGYDASFCLPFCMFGCESLVKLNLELDLNLKMISIRVPSMICLPRLKHLALKWVTFADNESAEKLLSHPMLEELILFYCTWRHVTNVNVNSPKLQSLSIDDHIYDCPGYYSLEDNWSEELQVCFFGDNLKFFHYTSDWPTQYCICGSTMQLKEAEISVGIPSHKFQDMDGPSSRYCKLVNSLSMVQNLTLSDATVKSFYLLSLCPWLQTPLPVFERVTRLNFNHSYDGMINIESVWLKMLYSRCPHLEHLNFKEMIALDCLTEKRAILRPMPSCFRTHLKKITLRHYEPEREYEDPINLLFNSAPVLEEVVIYWRRDRCISRQASNVEKLERELNTRPKVSENCRVRFLRLRKRFQRIVESGF